MVAYELFCFDEKSGYEFIGILPERRKDPKRITNESVLNWGGWSWNSFGGQENPLQS